MSIQPSGTVTFLFTDIEGSTRLAQQFPGAWQAAKARHDAILRSAIEPHGGYIFQTIGDAFCAAFHTAPDALTTALDAQRALVATAWGDASVRVRMGIHTGAAAVRPDGDYEGYLALARAQRVASAGHGGQVLVSRAAEELLHDHLPPDTSLRDLGAHRLKGLVRAEQVFQVVCPDLPANFPPLRGVESADAHAEAMTTPGRRAQGPLVGRAEPLRRLTERMDALKGGAGGTVLVSGEPGIGKSRLIEEVLALARTRGYHVLIGRCFERDSGIPYMPISNALETYARTCSPAEWQRLLSAAGNDVSTLLLDFVPKHSASWSASGAISSRIAESVISVQDSVRPDRAVRNLILELTMSAPCVLVVDDLHWADPPSLELIRDIALYAHSTPLLVLGAYREVELERAHPLSRLLVELNHERLLVRERLHRLLPAETRSLLVTRLGDPLPPGFAELIQEQTEGNPFFVEELVNGLIEEQLLVRPDPQQPCRLATGVTIDALAGQVPQGIRAAIGARLDRLDRQTQQLLGLAAIIGRRFALDVLRGLASARGFDEDGLEEALTRAQEGRFITPVATPTAAHDAMQGFTSGATDIEADFAFDHPLIHQVVYGEVDRRRRRRLHGDVGQLIETLYRGRESLYAERIAFHYMESDDEAQALRYSLMAGDKMFFAYYNRDMALGYYLPALEMVVAREPLLRHLGARSPVPVRQGVLHNFSVEEYQQVVGYLEAVIQAANKTPAAKAVAMLASRICTMAFHTGAVYAESIRLYEQHMLGPDVQKLVVPTERGNLVGILEFPGPGGPYPVVMLFHGIPSSKEVLTDEARRYHTRGMATVRPDLPGFGETTVPTTRGPADGEIMKQLVTALLAHERVDKAGVGVIGWSYGPWVAAHLCARDDRVRAMVSISGGFDLADDSRPKSARFRAFVKARWGVGMWPSPDADALLPIDHSAFLIADQIRCPVLIMYGATEQPELVRRHSDKLAMLVPTAEKRVWRSGLHALLNVPEALEEAADWMKDKLTTK